MELFVLLNLQLVFSSVHCSVFSSQLVSCLAGRQGCLELSFSISQLTHRDFLCDPWLVRLNIRLDPVITTPQRVILTLDLYSLTCFSFLKTSPFLFSICLSPSSFFMRSFFSPVSLSSFALIFILLILFLLNYVILKKP